MTLERTISCLIEAYNSSLDYSAYVNRLSTLEVIERWTWLVWEDRDGPHSEIKNYFGARWRVVQTIDDLIQNSNPVEALTSSIEYIRECKRWYLKHEAA